MAPGLEGQWPPFWRAIGSGYSVRTELNRVAGTTRRAPSSKGQWLNSVQTELRANGPLNTPADDYLLTSITYAVWFPPSTNSLLPSGLNVAYATYAGNVKSSFFAIVARS